MPKSYRLRLRKNSRKHISRKTYRKKSLMKKQKYRKNSVVKKSRQKGGADKKQNWFDKMVQQQKIHKSPRQPPLPPGWEMWVTNDRFIHYYIKKSLGGVEEGRWGSLTDVKKCPPGRFREMNRSENDTWGNSWREWMMGDDRTFYYNPYIPTTGNNDIISKGRSVWKIPINCSELPESDYEDHDQDYDDESNQLSLCIDKKYDKTFLSDNYNCSSSISIEESVV